MIIISILVIQAVSFRLRNDLKSNILRYEKEGYQLDPDTLQRGFKALMFLASHDL